MLFNKGYKSTNKLMQQVLLSLLIGIGSLFFYMGFGIIWQLLLAVITALVCEALLLWLRKKPIYLSLSDGSALVTGLLLAISIPSIAPWWLIVLGVCFALVFGKHLYGGLGNNPFNPAMLGYVFLLISYPFEMTQWQGVHFLSLTQSMDAVFGIGNIDAITGATPLDRTYDIASSSIANVWIWSNIGFLIGGLYLIARSIITWHIPVSLLLGVCVTVFVLNTFGVDTDHTVFFHLFSGATMLAAFFIATDPVSASTTPKGRLIYGFSIGVLIIIIRDLSGNYPDGVAFAVLLMNILTPLIDTYTKPKPLGGIAITTSKEQ